MTKKTTQQPEKQQRHSEPLRAGVESPQPARPDKAGHSSTIPVAGIGGSAGSRQELQATIEEFEASNEDLRVAHEEVVFTNEELQVAIEELETSKKELQSVNEELTIANSRLQEKIEKLDTANSEMANSLKATEKEVEPFSQNEKLKRKILELEQVNQEMEAFIHSISHDLRAPLRSVSEFSRIVTEDYAPQLDAQAQDYLARIRRGAEKMNLLVEGLLRLSRISRQKLDRTECELSKMASTIVADLRDGKADRKVEVEIQAGLTAFADPVLINIVLTNLMDNAWKFTSKTEHARIEFGALKDGLVHTAQEGAVYYVKDNGAGFNPEYNMAKMFTPFHRLHTDREFEGVGIGLATVERIIHRHGGRIWAEGKPEAGATLFFTLPGKQP